MRPRTIIIINHVFIERNIGSVETILSASGLTRGGVDGPVGCREVHGGKAGHLLQSQTQYQVVGGGGDQPEVLVSAQSACRYITYRQTYRQADLHTDRQADLQTDRQSDRQTDRQTGRQAFIHIDRQTYR